MSHKYTHEEFLEKVHEKNPKTINYTFLTEYIGSDKIIKCKCNICNKEWEPTPSHLLFRKQGCPRCAGSETRTQEEAFRQFKEKGFSLMGEYTGVHDKVPVVCDICGYSYDVEPNSILNNNCGCPNCAGNIKYTDKQLKEIIYSNNNKVIVLGDCNEGMDSFVLTKCKICGREWNAYVRSLAKGCGCQKCSLIEGGLKHRITHEEFILRIPDDAPKNIKIVGKYRTATDPIDCVCEDCGTTFSRLPDGLIKGYDCPVCGDKASSLETKCSTFFNDHNIDFLPQYKFDGCIGLGKRRLPFDFYLPKYNLLIECQGKQHEEPIEWFGGDEAFKKQQVRDEIKRKYAEENNIKFVEIWYWQIDDIEKILSELLLNNEKTA